MNNQSRTDHHTESRTQTRTEHHTRNRAESGSKSRAEQSAANLEKNLTKKRPDLFESLDTNTLSLSNRIVMAPMTRSRAIGSIPNDLMATYYRQRSSSGLIITEGTSPSPNGLGYARIPGIFNRDQVEGWKKITDSVHSKDGKIFLQIMHTGRISHPANLPDGGRVLAPSAVQAGSDMWTDESGMQPLPIPEAMTGADIEQAIGEFTTAAENAIEAGFDGVELHGANGYLLEQFLNPRVNRRTDDYGGSVANRLRFVIETTAAVGCAIGKEKTGIRLSPFNTFNDMPEYSETVETYEALVSELNRLDILYLHIVEFSARHKEEGRRLLESIREKFGNLLIVNGGYTTTLATDALKDERADLVSFGTPFISNPDLPKRLEQELPLTPPDKETFYSPGERGYTDYSFHS